MARYKPLMRAAGMPKIMPTAVVISPASGMHKKTGMGVVLASQAEANAPKPNSAACPSEICPDRPTRRFSPMAAMP